jgi:hypothetical protein
MVEHRDDTTGERPPETTVSGTPWVDRFSGKMGDVWGDHEDNMRYLDEERASWSERFPDRDTEGGCRVRHRRCHNART